MHAATISGLGLQIGYNPGVVMLKNNTCGVAVLKHVTSEGILGDMIYLLTIFSRLGGLKSTHFTL